MLVYQRVYTGDHKSNYILKWLNCWIIQDIQFGELGSFIKEHLAYPPKYPQNSLVLPAVHSF